MFAANLGYWIKDSWICNWMDFTRGSSLLAKQQQPWAKNKNFTVRRCSPLIFSHLTMAYMLHWKSVCAWVCQGPINPLSTRWRMMAECSVSVCDCLSTPKQSETLKDLAQNSSNRWTPPTGLDVILYYVHIMNVGRCFQSTLFTACQPEANCSSTARCTAFPTTSSLP